jgi:carboxypeptidase C (cathepsin A)
VVLCHWCDVVPRPPTPRFLQAFLSSHESLQGREFFIFGESYGGHFVPATAFRIFQGNQQQKQGTLHVNLAVSPGG